MGGRPEGERAGGGRPAAGPAGGRGQRRQGAARGSPYPIRSGGRGRLFFLLGNMCKEVPRGNGVIFIVESHLSALCSHYLLMAHGRRV